MAGISQILAALAAVGGLVFVGIQLRQSRRVADLQILQEFTQRIIERESALLHADEPGRKEHAFVELLNFLESIAAAFNGNLYPKTSKKIIRDALINSISVIQLDNQWSEKLLASVRTASTFLELRNFMAREKRPIATVTEQLKLVASSRDGAQPA